MSLAYFNDLREVSVQGHNNTPVNVAPAGQDEDRKSVSKLLTGMKMLLGLCKVDCGPSLSVLIRYL